MCTRVRVLTAVLLALLARSVAGDWVVQLKPFGSPAGITHSDRGIHVFSKGEACNLAEDGSMLGCKSYSVEAQANLQIENVEAAREGFVVAGVHISPDLTARPSVIRLDAQGEVQWARAVDATWLTNMTCAVEVANGDVFFVTRQESGLLLIRFSASGELKWARFLDRTDVDDIKRMIATRDGGVLLVTFVLNRAAALTRIGPDGDVLWDRVLGTADAGYGFYDAVEQGDGGFIAVGRSRIYRTSNRNGWLVRVSSTGKVLWQKTLGGSGEEGLFSVARLSDGEFVAAGGTNSTASGDTDTWLVMFTADGTIKRELAIGIPGRDDGPTDFDRPRISSHAGDVLLGSSAGLTLMVARVRDASPTCNISRRIESPVVDADGSLREVILAKATVTPTIRSIKITTRQARENLETTCTWSAAATAPKPEMMQTEALTDEDLFVEEIAKLLIAREFRKLDAIAGQLRTGGRSFDSGASKLRAFYETLGRHRALAALGVRHEGLLSDWHAATRSATSRIARASFDYAAAEIIRGAGFYDSLLPSDARTHGDLLDKVLTALDEIERSGDCDAPCFDLQIRAATLGGWSEPLQKLLEVDPTYWEAFRPAALYLTPNWGGRPGDVERFIENAAERTRDSLGDAVYALHYSGWRFGTIYLDDPPPPPQWARMRKGFYDFLRLFPKSRLGSQRFAAAAYRVARDRTAARSLFRSPMLQWASVADVWDDRAEYDRAKAWALAKPAAPFIEQVAAGQMPSERLVAPAVMTFADGTEAIVLTFVVETSAGPVGISATGRTAMPGRNVRTLAINDGQKVPLETTALPAHIWIAFKPSPILLAAIHPLKPRSIAVETGDRLFIIADRVIPVRAKSVGGWSFAAAPDSVVAQSLAGAPVLDDTGAVAGVVQLGTPAATDGSNINAFEIRIILEQILKPSGR